jgi:acetylornithine deacetylase
VSAELSRLLDGLVAFPTIAGESNEALVDYVRAELAASGVPCTVIPSSRPDGLNLYAVIGPAAEAGIVLSAHTDVVAVEGQRWSSDPFRVRRVEDRVFGRGTADMKGFIAAALAVVPYATERELRRPLHIALSCDEELGCVGVGSLLDLLAAASSRPELCIVGEPTGMRVADRHKGKVALRVLVRGRAGHSSAPLLAVNAVSYAARLITELDEIGRGLVTPRDESFTVPHATLSIGPIHGGVSTNIVPDACSFEFELRNLPGQDPEVVLGDIRDRVSALEREMQAVAPEAAITLEQLAAYPPLAPASPPVRLFGVAEGDPIAVDFGTEAGLYSERLGVPVMICGPGSIAQAHRPDEYIEFEQLLAAERFLRGVVDQLCAE